MKLIKKTPEAEIKYLRGLIEELRDHLDYCGWGDAWERECAEDLINKMDKYGRKMEKLNGAD